MIRDEMISAKENVHVTEVEWHWHWQLKFK